MTPSLLLFISYSMGIVGLLLNAILIRAIRNHTPVVLRVYAAIFRASAYIDCAALLTMMFTTTREVIFKGSCIMEFYGVCSLMNDQACWNAVGLQVYFYSTTYTLLCLSFAFRYYSLGKGLNEKKVSWLIFYALLLNIHEMPTYSHSLAIGFTQKAYIEDYKHDHVVEAFRWSVVYFPDLFSSFTMSFSMFTALIYFLIMVGIRSRTIARFAHYEAKMSSGTRTNQAMLNDALNVQLAASSFWFIGGTLFTINVIFEGTSPNFAHYTPSIINLQNISTPLTNLCIITPYRKSIFQFIRRQANRISNRHQKVAIVAVNSI